MRIKSHRKGAKGAKNSKKSHRKDAEDAEKESIYIYKNYKQQEDIYSM